ncbi:polysaccharide biosynthesis tyrosine autokinase [Cryobacterium sp. TMT1-3]|uniref:non-specific protein-tyrosine kinase n=1 Tax=Cryobacterium luteum TaxID=1424661 RepID=A0A1H8BMX3_9MICO|nr:MULTISPECIES: polysaccharide biosynthesis tyrosine autokinase [Cryobacterium]TFB89076.1 polysaccharide biosynthesis tyrosine autokinase [Cryobacterium luteum]TFC29588.1 polysaccharide biosynthesis tyrosine autokinase [Cryobacterium sp. TMT1-3]SEM84126.1 capsular exopolysaccharide family [Cryobacterium luteum]
MEPIDYLRTITRRWLLIIIVGLLGGAVAWGYAATLPAQYQATNSVFVTSDRGETTSELLQTSTFTQNLVESYAQLATTPTVLGPVISRLGLDISTPALASRVSAVTPLNTVFIEITVTSRSAVQAVELADAVSDSLATAVENLAPKGPDNLPSITVKTVSPAQLPGSPFAPNTQLIVLTGLLVGLVLGVLYALAREMFDTRVSSEKDLDRVSSDPLLGKVGRKKRTDPAGLVMRVMPHSAMAESYRRVRANLEFIDVDSPPRSAVVTSAVTRDGKSTTAINLALAMAERSSRVLLIDADLRRPSIAELCDLEGDVGLTTVLLGDVGPDDAIVRWSDGLDVLPSGAVPPNPGQLLGSDAMKTLMHRLLQDYDFIVVDSPPLLPATDALGLSHLTDGAIVVARYKSTTRQQLATTLESLEAVNARILGIVLNQVRERRAEVYYGPLAPVTGTAPRPPGTTNRVTATRVPRTTFDETGRRSSRTSEPTRSS